MAGKPLVNLDWSVLQVSFHSLRRQQLVTALDETELTDVLQWVAQLMADGNSVALRTEAADDAAMRQVCAAASCFMRAILSRVSCRLCCAGALSC